MRVDASSPWSVCVGEESRRRSRTGISTTLLTQGSISSTTGGRFPLNEESIHANDASAFDEYFPEEDLEDRLALASHRWKNRSGDVQYVPHAEGRRWLGLDTPK